MDRHENHTRALAALAAAFLLGGCAGGPGQSATQTAVATATPSLTVPTTAPATTSPPAAATATPAATATGGRVGATWRGVNATPPHWGVDAMAVTGSLAGWIALGSITAGTAPTEWTSADGMSWQQGRTVPLPEGVTSDTVTALTSLGRTAYGLGVTSDSHAIVWQGQLNDTWQVIGSGALFDLGPCPAGCASVRSIAASRAGVVLAGYRVKAVGDGFDLETDLWSSRDGATWARTEAPIPAGSTDRPAAEIAVAAFHDGFIAAGTLCDASGRVCRAVTWTSADGRTWTAPVDLPNGKGARAQQLAIGFDGAVVVGMRCTTESGCQLVAWATPDGATWVMSDLAGTYVEGSTELAAAFDTFVVVTSTDDAKDKVWTSTGGLHWTSEGVQPGLDPAVPLGQVLELAGRSGGLLAVGLVSGTAEGEKGPGDAFWVSP